MSNMTFTYYARIPSCANIYLNGTINGTNDWKLLQIAYFMVKYKTSVQSDIDKQQKGNK